jgi:putative transposase
METKSKNHTITEIGYHIVLVTKFRHCVFKSGVDVILKNIIGEICLTYDWKIHSLEVMEDHIHVFLQVGPNDIPSNIVKTLKSISAVRIFYAFPKLKIQKFWGSGLWSRGYYIGTCGNMTKDVIKKYIDNQKKSDKVKTTPIPPTP